MEGSLADQSAQLVQPSVVGGEAVLPRPPGESAPPWLAPFVRQTIWRLVATVLGMAVLAFCVIKARGLISTLVVALFFSIAMDPAVSWLHKRRGWSRARAAGTVLAVVVVSVIVLITVLIPALVTVAQHLGDRLPVWVDQIERTFHVQIGQSDPAAAKAAMSTWLQQNGSEFFGLAKNTVGMAFQFLTTAMFTLYLAADSPKIRRGFLMRLPAEKQMRVGWAWDTAIVQTGGYFYSRLLLLVINAALFFFVMVLVGVPVAVALPMSIFQGFFAEFIPVVGTYIGAGIPILVTLVLQGVWPAVALVVWTLIYQQVENYWLSPKLSARTMEINGGVAFGAALAGGAIAGPMGAFMAMPVAAMITSFVKHYVPKHELVYRSALDDDLDTNAPDTGAQASDNASPRRPAEV